MNELQATVVGFVIDGNSKDDIVEWLQKKHPEQKEPATLFDDAVTAIKKRHEEMRGEYRSFAMVGLRELYRRCVEVGDYKAAGQFLKDLEKMEAKNDPLAGLL
jgi:hypothetical protein